MRPLRRLRSAPSAACLPWGFSFSSFRPHPHRCGLARGCTLQLASAAEPSAAPHHLPCDSGGPQRNRRHRTLDWLQHAAGASLCGPPAGFAGPIALSELLHLLGTHHGHDYAPAPPSAGPVLPNELYGRLLSGCAYLRRTLVSVGSDSPCSALHHRCGWPFPNHLLFHWNPGFPACCAPGGFSGGHHHCGRGHGHRGVRCVCRRYRNPAHGDPAIPFAGPHGEQMELDRRRLQTRSASLVLTSASRSPSPHPWPPATPPAGPINPSSAAFSQFLRAWSRRNRWPFFGT
mmetsp:Transcript_105837/g.182559  ORF Transcript_105837/g.182559 Transcript_105837/m.182559 type:complete len:288 (-) Transcript_105837:1152-2015(-)